MYFIHISVQTRDISGAQWTHVTVATAWDSTALEMFASSLCYEYMFFPNFGLNCIIYFQKLKVCQNLESSFISLSTFRGGKIDTLQEPNAQAHF